MFGRRRVTLPFSDYSDLIADTAADRDALLAAGRAANIPWLVRSHDTQLGASDACAGQREFVHHIIDVTPSVDDLRANLSSMARRNTRKAENDGVEIFEGTTKDHLRAWVDLHRNLRREKYHLLVQPFSFFENIWDEFIAPGDGFLLLAANNGQIIAGTVYVNSGDTCYYKFNASSADSLGTGVRRRDRISSDVREATAPQAGARPFTPEPNPDRAGSGLPPVPGLGPGLPA
jgi:hypothetical protein